MKIIVLFTKYREKGRINALFITVFCLLCFCPVPQLFKSCHLVCTICLTPMSECVWHNGATVLLSCSIYSSIMRNQQRDWHGARCHTYSPMKLFLGHMAYLQGGTWLFWLCGTRSTDLDLSSSEGCLESTLPSWLKESNFFGVPPLGTHLPASGFTVSDRWLDCQKAAAVTHFGEKTSQTNDGDHGDMLWDLSCHNCPSSLWDTLFTCSNPYFSLVCVQCDTSPKE